MEECQIKTITQNLPELIRVTRFNAAVKADLLANDIFGRTDVEELDAERDRNGETAASYKYYDCLMTRVGAYQVLVKALEENKQTGAVRILIDGIQNLEIKLDVFKETEIEFNGKRFKLEDFFPTEKLKLAHEIFQRSISTLELYDSFVTKQTTFTLATSNIPPEPPFYVPRFLSNRIEVDKSIFKADCPDVFVFRKSIARYKLSEIASPHWTAASSSQLNHLKARFIYLDEYQDWIDLKQKAKVPIHLISYEAEQRKFILEESSAAHEILSKVGSKEKRAYLSEEEFVQRQFSEDFKVSNVCICDTPGMGKTFLFGNIARALSKNCTGTVVAFIQLSTFVADCSLSSTNASTDSESAFLNVLKYVSSRHTELLLALIQAELLRIEILFDGFDEIPSDKVEWMKQVFLSIKSKLPSVRIYIASRPHMQHELERGLGVIAYDILPFNSQNQVDFLVKFWSSNVVGLDQIPLENYARNCLEEISKTLTKNDKEMAGIPLLCQLIAEVCANKVHFYSTTGARNTELACRIPQLYEQFIKQRIEAVTSTEEEIKNIKLFHIFHALKLLFPTHSFHDDKVFIKLNQLMAFSVVLKAGIIQQNSNTKFEFIHRTFAEYFAAEYFSGKLRQSILKPSTLSHKTFTQNDEIEKCLTLLLATRQLELHDHGDEDDDQEFMNSVVVSFVDFNLSENRNSEKTTSGVALFCASLSPWKFLSIFCACCHHNFYSLFSLLKEASTKWNFNQIKTYFTTENCYELLTVCIKWSTSQMFHSCIQLLTEELKLDVEQIVNYDQENSLLHRALKQANYEAVEYFVNSVSFEPTNILWICVRDSHHNDMDMIRRRENILHLLINKNTTLIQDTPDILVASRIDLGLFKILVNSGANLTAVDGLFWNCVMLATYYMTPCDYHELVQFLLKDCKAEYLFLENEKWKDPLSHIIKYARLLPETMELLFNIPGIDINIKDRNGEKLLFSVVWENQLDNLQQLVKRGLDYNARGINNQSLMHTAARYGQVDMVRYLLSLELDPNSCDDGGWTPLHCAARSYSIDTLSVVKVLVEHGTNIQAKNNRGRTALHLFVARECLPIIDVMQYLIESGAGVNDRDKDGNTPLHLCTKREAMACLIGMGADIHAKNNNGRTALHLSAAYDSPEEIECLIENGAGVNDRDKDGNTPLHLCTKREAMDCLIGMGADIHAKNIEGQTALHFSAAKAHSSSIEVIQYLIGNGAGVNDRDKGGNTPLHLCLTWDVVSCLIGLGADIHAKNIEGQTALHLSAAKGHSSSIKVIQYLIGNGAGVNDRDKGGNTPLHLCLTWDVVSCLIGLGADIHAKNIEGQTPAQKNPKEWRYRRRNRF